MRLPLEGIRVIDITVVWAGPFATQFLADWGAEVIRVESLQRLPFVTRASYPNEIQAKERGGISVLNAFPDGDPGERPYDRSAMFNTHARNKLSMTVDLTQPEGLDIFKRLIKESDIFIENNAKGTIERLGIGYDELKKVKPDLIMISATGQGRSGPFSHYKTWGVNVENYVGHAFLWGYTDLDVSMRPRVNHSDASGGATIALAALMALNHRRNTGEGQYIDASLYETIIPQFSEPFMDWTMNQRPHQTIGNRDFHGAAPQGVYPCRNDKWVAISVCSDEEWHAFCKIMDNPDWTKQEIFTDVLSRYNHQDELDKEISEWTIGHTNYEIMERLQHAGVAAAPVLDEKDAPADKHLAARGFFETVTHPIAGTYINPGQAFKMSKAPNHIRGPFAIFGGANEYIYKQVIGVSDEEYEELKTKGHIGDTPTNEALKKAMPQSTMRIKKRE